MGNKDKVYRLWDKYCHNRKFLNNDYLSMISSLIMLDDMDGGAERFLEEWGQGRTYFDIRFPDLIISAFHKRGLLEKADGYINQLKEIGKEPKSRVWSLMAQSYHAGNEMGNAVKALEKAIKLGSWKWVPEGSMVKDPCSSEEWGWAYHGDVRHSSFIYMSRCRALRNFSSSLSSWIFIPCLALLLLYSWRSCLLLFHPAC
ncbi:hypothetical protein MLD38_030539 [Melastoma candidum]|uniref:Uncharacterized protein n=1 Tax=Melastoma candidum TaxID=119954 RepID=A0ACB9MS57_9MYRT|nr:hypothetical protein MLD38_030539 [Melastoma candidum]